MSWFPILLLCVAIGPYSVKAQAWADGHGLGSEPPCADSCFEVNCDKIDIRYGKYCGVGHGGCTDEEPCDSVDRCCKGHDECVTMAGVSKAKRCHQDFIACLGSVWDKKDGFSTRCPYETVIPVMRDSIKMLMGMSQKKDEI